MSRRRTSAPAGIVSGQMDGTDETGRDAPETAQASHDLDALAVSDRFRLFNFTRRDDHLAYLWVLRALERLRADPGSITDLGAAGDPGHNPLTAARARVAARRDDIGEIRRLLDVIRDARAKRAYADQELTRKQAIEQRQQSEAEAAAARLAQARQAAAESLTAWTARWTAAEDTLSPDAPSFAAVAASLPRDVVTDNDVATLTAALDRSGEPGAASLSEIYDGCVADRQAAAIAARTSLGAALAEARRRLAGLGEERAAIAAERDDAPPSTDLRPASREDRPGAPLWQLVRFAPDVPDDTAAAIEGALYGAGLLTAWVHPDPALTAAALQAAEADGYLIPTVPAGSAQVTALRAGQTLADVLVAEDRIRVRTGARSVASTTSSAMYPRWHRPGQRMRRLGSLSPSSRRKPSSATVSTSAPAPRWRPSTLARPTVPPVAALASKSRTSA